MSLLDHLQTALADRYTIERELGGGGMSRVFLAREIALDRRVVLKLVPPELAASVSTERFRREMLLVAQLQHTNIVPILSAGDIDGTLYYSMPFVEGESLRARIDAAGALPIPDVVAVAADVLRALSSAHRRGIVHRDIKPDNILLADGGAVVTDFGIAKALGETTAELNASTIAGNEPTGALTQTGMIVGTPAYLAPEQAVPGAAIDARTDLYALGCVMYEMLTGQRVFAGLPAHQEIIAHLMTPAPGVAVKRPGVDRGLAAFVARLLEKDPDHRPASADAALVEVQRFSGPVRRSVVRWALGTAATVTILIVGGYLLLPRQLLASARTLMTRRPAVLHVNRVVIVPFANETGDPKLASFGAMIADWIGEGLTRLPNLEVVDSRTTMISGQVVKQIPKLLREKDDARAVAQETGAKVLITGSVYASGDQLTLRARVVDAATGALMQTLPEVTASRATPGAGLDELRKRVVATMHSASDTSVSSMPGVFSAPPSVEAYDELRKGIEGFFRIDPRTFEHLQAAMQIDTNYAAPYVFNAFATLVRLGIPKADTAVRAADRLRDRATPAELAALDYVHAVVDGDPGASTAAVQRFMAAQKGSMEAPLMVASNALATHHPQLALDALAKTDPDRGLNLVGPFYWLYLAEAERQLGDQKASLAAAREGWKRFPENGNAFPLLVVGLVNAGRLDELRQVLSEMRNPMMAVAGAALASGALAGAGRAEEAKAMANEWLARVPTDTAGGRAAGIRNVRMVLLLECQRWPELEAHARQWQDTTYGDARRLSMSTALAVALIHQQRTADAIAIEHAIAAQHPRYSRGDYMYARAVIAAHLGKKADAVALLEDALRNGFKLQFAGTLFGADVMLAPLHGFPAFDALLKRGA